MTKLSEPEAEALARSLTDRIFEMVRERYTRRDVAEAISAALVELRSAEADEETVEVRAVVRVDRTRTGLTYAIAGWSDPVQDDVLVDAWREQVDEFAANAGDWTEDPRWSTIRARVPIPPEIVTVDAEVEP